jgi:NADH-quinone oxidoreductase subunit M
MNLFAVPWLELTVLVPCVGGLLALLPRESRASQRLALRGTAATLLCAVLAWLGFHTGAAPGGAAEWEIFPRLLGFRLFEVDELNAPLVPLVALLHFLTILGTTGAKGSRLSFPLLLVGESLCVAVFAVKSPWALIAFLSLATIPPYLVLRRRGKPTRVYVIHMALFVVLLWLGWALVEDDLPIHLRPAFASVPLLLAVLIRSGTVPAHLWVANLFENCSFATALLSATPIMGVYAAVRLVVPVCPDWVLQSIGIFSLVTAVYAAGLAVVQTEARRFFAYLFLSHASMVLVGLELNTTIGLTGALCLWFSVALSLTGFGLTIRAIEARFGRLTLTSFRGLYDHSPSLAVCFLLTGLGSVGFPGTLGYVAAEMLVDSAVGADLAIGVALVLEAALNGIAVVRVYFLIFTGSRHVSAVPLGITPRERFAVLTLAVLILGGGLYPQPGVESRHRAAEAALRERHEKLGEK